MNPDSRLENLEPLLHIGFSKCASTWLQNHLFQPAHGYGTILNPFSLDRDFIRPDNIDMKSSRQQIITLLQERKAEGLLPVMSSESLCGDLIQGGNNLEKNAYRLKELFNGSAKILLVVREQRDLIRSLYKTLILFGSEMSLREIIQKDRPDDSGHFNIDFLAFDKIARLYTDHFGKDSVCVLPFEVFREKPQVFIDEIYKYSHIDSNLHRAPPINNIANSGEPLIYLYGQRWHNKLHRTASNQYRGHRDSNDFDRVMKRITWHKKHATPTRIDAFLEARFNAAVRKTTAGTFKSSNRALQSYCSFDLKELGYEL